MSHLSPSSNKMNLRSPSFYLFLSNNMKTFLIFSALFLLSSCWELSTQEVEEAKQYCKSVWQDFRLVQTPFGDTYDCGTAWEIDKVQRCIENYVDAIDEKYNNPDTVSNLREANYNEVVKTCQETFWSTKSAITP